MFPRAPFQNLEPYNVTCVNCHVPKSAAICSILFLSTSHLHSRLEGFVQKEMFYVLKKGLKVSNRAKVNIQTHILKLVSTGVSFTYC